MPRPPVDHRPALLTAAAACFAAHGVAGTSVDDICRSAGVAPMILYRQFGSRDGLVLALIDAWVAERTAAVAAARHLPLPEALRALVEVALALPVQRWPAARDDARLALAVVQAAVGTRTLGRRLRTSDTLLADALVATIRAAAHAGAIPAHVKPEAAAETLLAIGDGLRLRATLATRSDLAALAALRADLQDLALSLVGLSPTP